MPQPGQRMGSGSSCRRGRGFTAAFTAAFAGAAGGLAAGAGATLGTGAVLSSLGGRGTLSARTARAAGESPIGSPHSKHKSAPSSTAAPQLGHFMQR
jgi:hypothetical protein